MSFRHLSMRTETSFKQTVANILEMVTLSAMPRIRWLRGDEKRGFLLSCINLYCCCEITMQKLDLSSKTAIQDQSTDNFEIEALFSCSRIVLYACNAMSSTLPPCLPVSRYVDAQLQHGHSKPILIISQHRKSRFAITGVRRDLTRHRYEIGDSDSERALRRDDFRCHLTDDRY